MKAITKKPIHRMENLTDWGTAGAFTFTLDTDKKEGEYAFKIVNAAGAFNIYYRYDPVLDIDIKRYMRLWVKSPTSATFWLVLRTDAANFSTWINIATTPEYTEISIDLDNPDSTNGDGFDKTKLWSLEFFNPDPGTWYFDYANYETDVESKISECMIYSPTPQKPYTLCTMVIHPDNESYFVEGETIIIKDDSDVICFAGRIVEKDEKRTHYKLTALGWDHEFRGAMYKNSYTAKKTSQILEGQIDSSAYTYYDSSIDDTTITYTYKVAKRNNYMITLARWMERGVFYQVMEESEYKAYFDKEITDVNILPDSGETWVLGTTDGINHVGKKNLDIGLTRVHVWGTVNSDGQVNYIASSSAPEQEKGITPTYPFTDTALTNYTEVKQLADNLLAIFGTSQLFIELVVEGKGFLQPWYRVSYANASLSMAADDYAIAEWIYDAKGDIYTKFIITNGIAYESEFRTIQKQMTMRDDVINAEFIDVSVPVSTADGTVIPGARHDKFVWRVPEATAFDFTEATLTDNLDTYDDLDLSSIIPAGSTHVVLRVRAKDDVLSSYLIFRKKGQASVYQNFTFRNVVTGIWIEYQFKVGVDSDRKCEILCHPKPTDWGDIDIVVVGWFI